MKRDGIPLQLVSPDQVIARLRKLPMKQAGIARELHISRAFVHQVLTRRTSNPTPQMLDLVGVERRTIYVEKGSFPEEYSV